MNIFKRAAKRLAGNESLFSQVLLTYGTMTVILVLLVVFQFCIGPNDSATTGTSPVSDLKIWSLIINAYSPTTITFIAALIFDLSKLNKNKILSSILFFLVICMALTYMAFEAMYAQSANKQAIVFLGFLGLIAPAVALATLFFSTSDNRPDNQEPQTSDGLISARRRNENE